MPCTLPPMFYESRHSLDADYCHVETACDFSFPSHMHHCFEWITVTDGRMRVAVGEKEYLLSAGESVLIFPNQIHSLEAAPSSRHFLCLFSPRLVQAYTEKTAGKIPENNRFFAGGITEKAVSDAVSSNPILLKGILSIPCAACLTAQPNIGRETATRSCCFTEYFFLLSKITMRMRLSAHCRVRSGTITAICRAISANARAYRTTRISISTV